LQQAGIRVVSNATASSLRIEHGRIVSVSVRTGTDELEFVPDFVVSTVPLHELVSLLGSQLGREAHVALERILYRAVVIMYIVLRKPRMSPFHCIYFPQPEYIFQRLFEQENVAETPGSDGGTAVGAEISCFEGDSVWRASGQELFKQVAAGLERSGLATASEIAEFHTVREPYAYPMRAWNYRGALETVHDELCRVENLLPNGRHGLFALSGVDRSVEMALAAAEHIAAGQPSQSWRATIRSLARHAPCHSKADDDRQCDHC
jgi:UDP-galactopyranose mutase